MKIIQPIEAPYINILIDDKSNQKTLYAFGVNMEDFTERLEKAMVSFKTHKKKGSTKIRFYNYEGKSMCGLQKQRRYMISIDEAEKILLNLN
jgi:hypothetical protein